MFFCVEGGKGFEGARFFPPLPSHEVLASLMSLFIGQAVTGLENRKTKDCFRLLVGAIRPDA